MSDICPEKQPVMVAAGYPKIPLTAEEHKVQFEFQAPGHKTEVMEYTLRAGANTISFTLQPENVVAANVATLRYSGAPTGTTVECMSGPCPDQQVHPVTRPFRKSRCPVTTKRFSFASGLLVTERGLVATSCDEAQT